MKWHTGCPCRKFSSTYEIPDGLLNEEWAQKNHGQSLQRLNERGGITLSEALSIIQRRGWYEMQPEKAFVIYQHILYGFNIGICLK